MSNSKKSVMDGNFNGESVHEQNQGYGGPGKSVLERVADIFRLDTSDDESEKENHINDDGSLENDPLIGERVYGFVERRVEGQGCVITVRVGEFDIFLRGAVFPDARQQVKKKRTRS